ncbi:MAG: hypothetical protein D6805_00220 [Planctomycetota bacterium]|nr:MAG: hypothetical protein D6805_00220 [Planctomycetota bacterium]
MLIAFGVDELIVHPTVGGISLIKFLLFLMWIIHFPFIAMAIGGTLFSLLFAFMDKTHPKGPLKNSPFQRFSKDTITTLTFHPSTTFLLGILPLLTIILFMQQLLVGTPLADYSSLLGKMDFGFSSWGLLIPKGAYSWWLSVVLVIGGFLFLHIYKHKFISQKEIHPIHFLLGFTALGLLLLGYFTLTANLSFVLYPTMWNLVDNPLILLFGSNMLTQFGLFLNTALLIAAAATLYLLCSKPAENEEEKHYQRFVKISTLVITLVFTFANAAATTLNLLVIEEAATSSAVIVWHGILLVLGLLLAITSVTSLFDLSHVKHKSILVLTIATFLAMLLNLESMQANSLTEHLASLYTTAKKHQPHGPSLAPDPKIGKKLYQQNCKTCHTIDGTKGAGPSFLNIWHRTSTVIIAGKEKQITVDENYIKESLMSPKAAVVKNFAPIMPSFAKKLSEQDILHLIAYLKTLKK